MEKFLRPKNGGDEEIRIGLIKGEDLNLEEGINQERRS